MENSLNNEKSEEAEEAEGMSNLNLTEIIIFFWREKLLISIVTLLFAVLSVVYALSLTNIYMADARLLASEDASNPVSNLTSQLGGLANIAGVNLGGLQGQTDKARLAVEILNSRKFFEDYLYEEVVVDAVAASEWDPSSKELAYNTEIYDEEAGSWELDEDGKSFRPTVQSAFAAYRTAVDIVKEGPYTTISVRHLSPYVAKEWIELIVRSINEHIRKRDSESAEASIQYLTQQQRETALVNIEEVFSRLIEEQTKIMMLTNAKEDYVFEFIDPPVALEDRVQPNRALICILYTLLGVLVGTIFALIRSRIRLLDWGALRGV